jgi:hypothetical protein
MEFPPDIDPFSEETKSTEQPKPRSSRFKIPDNVWNVLTLLAVVGIVVFGVFYAMIFINPLGAFNPFPLPTLVPTLFIPSITPLPTYTQTPIQLPATITNTVIPTATITPIPPTPTAIQATPIGTLALSSGTPVTPTSKVTPVYSFALQGDPKPIDATLLDAAHGCNWMGVGGRVYDLQNAPATKIEVQLFGILNGNLLNETSLTGTARTYGEAGFECTLGNKAIASTQRLWIRLVDQSGVPLSDRIFFDTFAECNKNLIVINFKQVK